MPPASPLAGGLAAAALAFAGPMAGSAAAAGLTLEQALRREGIGDALLAPGDDVLLLERRRAYGDAARFDFDLLNPWFRTAIEGVDLRRPGPPRPLFPHDPRAGYRLGPIAPDGGGALVWELTDGGLRLLAVDLAASRATPLRLAPEYDPQTRTAAWLSTREVLLLVRSDGRAPAYLRAMRPWRDLPRRWEAQAAGGGEVVAYESGPTPGASPEPGALRLVRVDVTTGAARILAEGRFVDLEVAPSGRRVALLEAGAPHPLASDRPVQGNRGLATRRISLRLLDLDTGAQSAPCAGWDLMATLLTWAPNADRLLVYGRQGDQGWPEGRLLAVDAEGRQARPAAPGLRLEITGRPESVQAGWLEGHPVAFGRTSPDAAPAWFRATPRGLRRLDGPREARLHPDGMMFVEGGRLRLSSPDGPMQDLGPALALAPPYPTGARGRLQRRLTPAADLAAIRAEPGGRILTSPGAGGGARLPPDSRVLAWAAGRRSGLLLAPGRGGERQLLWATPAGVRTLATLNRSLADVDGPTARPVRHAAPDGRAVTSWLLLPARPADAPPPPLVVWIYPGRADAAPRAALVDIGEDRPPRPVELLAGRGYAVLAPSLPEPLDGRAPGDDLAAGVLAAVDAAIADPALAGAFDPSRLALVGHSFGGWGVLQTLTQTDRFKAAVALSGPSSLISRWGELQLPRRTDADGHVGAVTIDIGWVEDFQGRMNAPPWRDLPRYVRNSPALNADRIRTPVLIGHGEFDSMPPSEGERMFAALFRQGKPARLLTFFGEGHVFASPGSLRRLQTEMIGWLERHLGPAPRP